MISPDFNRFSIILPPLPEETELLLGYIHEMNNLPPILGTVNLDTPVKNRLYSTSYVVLRPYSEYTLIEKAWRGNPWDCSPLRYESMIQQARSWSSGTLHMRGYFDSYSHKENDIYSNCVLANVSDHEDMVGAMLLAGFKKSDIYIKH